MSDQHTPGEWVADMYFRERHGARTYIPILRPGNDPVPLAVVHLDVDGYGRDVGSANARLIAAAPDMLAALRDQRRALDILLAMLIESDRTFLPTKSPVWPMLLRGNAAIAKATGGSP